MSAKIFGPYELYVANFSTVSSGEALQLALIVSFVLINVVQGVKGVGSVSCQARVSQSRSSGRLVQQLLWDSEALRPAHRAHLCSYGVTDDAWQQALTGWLDVASCYGVDRQHTTSEDDSDY